MSNNPLNGSVNLLAQAMRDVFREGVERAVEPLATEMKAMRTDMRDMESRLNERIDTTNQNMQGQLAEQQKKIGAIGSNVSKLIKAQPAAK